MAVQEFKVVGTYERFAVDGEGRWRSLGLVWQVVGGMRDPMLTSISLYCSVRGRSLRSRGLFALEDSIHLCLGGEERKERGKGGGGETRVELMWVCAGDSGVG